MSFTNRRMQSADQLDTAATMSLDEVPEELARNVALLLESGALDDWIELILSAGHARKLALRRVKGFS